MEAAAAAVALVFRKFLRVYMAVTALLFSLDIGACKKQIWGHQNRGCETIIQSIYKMPDSSDIKTRYQRCQARQRSTGNSNTCIALKGAALYRTAALIFMRPDN